MQDITPEHLATVMLQAKRENELHRHNVGIYGNSSEDTPDGWLQVRDYYDRKTIATWEFNARRPRLYRNAMAAAERCLEVYCERILATRIQNTLANHAATAAERRTLH